MKKILVIGASGDTGRYFIQYLLANKTEDYDIVAAGGRSAEKVKDMGVPYIQIDITKESEFEKLPTDIYAVVSLAGYMPARMSGYHPNKYFEVNTIGTLNILEYCRKTKVDRILYATSFGDILGNLNNDILLKADSKRDFSYTTDHTAYVISKIAAVELIKNYREMYGLKTFVFRLPNIYLLSESDMYCVDGVERKIGFHLLIDKAIKGQTIEVFGDDTRVKDMVYVKDFCQMLYKACFIDRDEGLYNVGTGIGTSLREIIEGIIDVFGEPNKKSKLIMRPDMPNTPQYIMDITEAREQLGYEPEYTYLDMLKDMRSELNNR